MNKLKRPYLILLTVLTFMSKGQNNLFGGGFTPFNSGNAYAEGTIVFSAIDATFTTFNIIRLVNTDHRKSNAAFGLLFGSAQTAYGLININAVENNSGTLTALNIGLGLTTVVTSGLRLLKKEPLKENSVTFNFLYLPPLESHSGALCFALKGTIK